MKVKFKVNAEWEEEVEYALLVGLAEDQGIEGDEPSQEELNQALEYWTQDRADSINENPTENLPERVTLSVSHEIIL